MLRRAVDRSWRIDRFQHPAQAIVAGYGVVVAVGTGLLSLPVATGTGRRADVVDALFTATPATLRLTVLMFVGRVGPLTAATALALRERTRRFELPEERTIVG